MLKRIQPYSNHSQTQLKLPVILNSFQDPHLQNTYRYWLSFRLVISPTTAFMSSARSRLQTKMVFPS